MTDEVLEWLVKQPTEKIIEVLMGAGRISWREEDMAIVKRVIDRLRTPAPEERSIDKAMEYGHKHRLEAALMREWRDLAHEAFLQLEYVHLRTPDERRHSSTVAVLARLSEKLGVPLESSQPQSREEPK